MSDTSDQFDAATVLEEMFREKALQAQLAHTRGTGRPDCQDCGEDIPEPRRQAAPWAVRCIECQEIDDKRRRTGQ